MSGGYAYGEHEPTERCPYCNAICRADFVDIGIGFQQCGPFHCEECRASEIGPYDEPRDLTDRERKTSWYEPDSEPGSSANVIGGKIVSHVVMNRAYRDEFIGNPLHDYPGYVDEWRETIRKPCQKCAGEGTIYTSRYGGNDPDVYPVGKCEACDGSGDQACEARGCSERAVAFNDDGEALCEDCLLEWMIAAQDDEDEI